MLKLLKSFLQKERSFSFEIPHLISLEGKRRKEKDGVAVLLKT